MTTEKNQEIRYIYGDILGLADHLPEEYVERSTIELYNGAIDTLNDVSGIDFSRFRVTKTDAIDDRYYPTSAVKPIMGSILSRLEQQFGFFKPSRGEQRTAPMIMTVNNTNQLNLTVVPIQEILQNITDADLRADVEDLRAVVQGDKNKKKASSILNAIQQKSWDVFIALLPTVLEHLGKQPPTH